MNLNKYLPLTETTYYILMSLMEPGHGYYIMQKVEELSGGKVRVAAGTMYGAIENLIKQNLITFIPGPDPRRKVYQITSEGFEVLKLEAGRLRHMVDVAAARGL
jgi:DNA-binding PadR family transcriptional regulator